jgi:hypothetical protein
MGTCALSFWHGRVGRARVARGAYAPPLACSKSSRRRRGAVATPCRGARPLPGPVLHPPPACSRRRAKPQAALRWLTARTCPDLMGPLSCRESPALLVSSERRAGRSDAAILARRPELRSASLREARWLNCVRARVFAGCRRGDSPTSRKQCWAVQGQEWLCMAGHCQATRGRGKCSNCLPLGETSGPFTSGNILRGHGRAGGARFWELLAGLGPSAAESPLGFRRDRLALSFADDGFPIYSFNMAGTENRGRTNARSPAQRERCAGRLVSAHTAVRTACTRVTSLRSLAPRSAGAPIVPRALIHDWLTTVW